MKILKMVLKNFSAIKNSMNCNKIEIDFSNSYNKICLLIGPNGSGKTTLLSLMNPFADLGNLDVRNGNNLILEDKEGYKEIHIRKNKDVYAIKHFYSPHKGKSHSVKSYIEKNGNEMNVNGNVTSFKEYVREELQIEPDYLKLIRLGSNVTSLIDLTATERKNFMSKIMDDIGLYLEYYKSVNTKLRQLDEMISHNVDKINRLGVLDKKDIVNEIEDLKNSIKQEEELFLQENNKQTLLKNTINNIEDAGTLKERLHDINKKYNKMTSVLERKDQIESYDVNFYTEKINELEKIILTKNNDYSSNIAIIQNSLQHLNTLQEQLRTYEVQFTKEEESDKELSRMNEHLDSIRLKLREYENTIGEFEPDYTKEELDSFIVFLKNTQQLLNRTYDFGKPPVERVISLLRDKKNVLNYINSHLIDLDEKKNDVDSLLMARIASQIATGNKEIIINCKEECQAKRIFIQLQNLLNDSEIEDRNEDEQFYRSMEFVYSNLLTVLPKFSEYKTIIDKLPKEIKDSFIIDTLYNNISKLGMIYDEKKINDLMSLVTEYDNYSKLLETYANEEDTISKFSNLSNSSYVKTMIDTLQINISELRKEITELKEKNLKIQEDISECNRSLEVYEEIKETIEKYDEVRTLFEKLTNEYAIYTETIEKITNCEIQITRLKLNIDSMNTELQRKISTLDQYTSLTKELKKMNQIYDEMTYTKNSLSSKEGMPLQFISSYLNNTEEMTNELLDIAYDGKIFIDKFNITANEFSIPFYNKGVRLDDVKYASQGELSFLSIALSFALSRQALSKYNIMLLDEIDGPLDTVNREKFIQILETQIDRINSEQNFLITHNAMFSSYPVDIIDLSFKNNHDSYPLANFIDIKRID